MIQYHFCSDILYLMCPHQKMSCLGADAEQSCIQFFSQTAPCMLASYNLPRSHVSEKNRNTLDNPGMLLS